jgi:hypothetical protein
MQIHTLLVWSRCITWNVSCFMSGSGMWVEIVNLNYRISRRQSSIAWIWASDHRSSWGALYAELDPHLIRSNKRQRSSSMTPHCHLQNTPKQTDAHALVELRHPYCLTLYSSSQYDLAYNHPRFLRIRSSLIRTRYMHHSLK